MDVQTLRGALNTVPLRIRDRLSEIPASARDAPIGLLASGRHTELLGNLQLKFLEGLLRPLPPAWELLDFAHGPYQQAFERRATLLALRRVDAPGEAEVLERLSSLLDPQRHVLVELPATLPGPWALVEHEALLSEWVVDAMERDGIHPGEWPGRGNDAALYQLRPDAHDSMNPLSRRAPVIETTRQLESTTWPELAARLARGPVAALLPLGATEQHGPHLPFATDTWIAEALAERLTRRLPETVALPALPVGCSSEHLGFPGTLSIAPSTLRSLLDDLLASLTRHGFARVFVFSAHGGNCQPLADALPGLRTAHPDLQVGAFTDLAALAHLQQSSAKSMGISPTAAGHHAGEFETSILRALRPALVRVETLEAGRLHPGTDAQHLFYPSLRDATPSGTLGDPRGASAQRAERYLDNWAELLEFAYGAAWAP